MRMYSRALAFFLPDWQRVGILVLLIGTIVALSTALAWPMAILVDVILTTTPKAGWVHELFASYAPSTPIAKIVVLALIYVLIKGALDLCSVMRAMLGNSIKYRGTVRVRRALYSHLHTLGTAYYSKQPQGDLIFRLSNDTFGPYGIFDTIVTTGQHAVTLMAVTAVMFTRSASLTFFALSLAPLMLLANWYFGKRIKRRADESRQIDADLMTFVQRTVSTMPLIQAYNRHRHEHTRYGASLEKSVGASMRLHWQENLFPLVIQFIYGLGQAVLLGYGGYLVYRDQIATQTAGGVSYGDLMLFMGYFSQMLNPLSEVSGFTARVKTSVAASERVFTVLDQRPAVAESPEALGLPVKPRALHIHDVSFAYQPGSAVIENVSAHVAPGEMVAFIGASGAGKSTLLNLLPRFYDPSSGNITLGGHDLRKLTLSSLRQHVLIVSQENWLLAGTIDENIRYGNLDAGAPEVRRAAEMAGLDEFIEALPDGYQTTVLEGGKNLSGGQRQRLAIARALMTASPILVFDEPTSGLDVRTEQQIVNTLVGLKHKRTVILVTHKLSNVQHCDRIYVFHDGRIVRQGSYARLLRNNGFEALPKSPECASVA